MREHIRENRRRIKELFDLVETTDAAGASQLVEEALENSISLIVEQVNAGGKLFFIGNGGSAAIASHMATDFWKNTGIRAMTFNDSVLLTCVSNDEGYQHVFERSIEMFAEPKDVLIAISSSGKSENILRAVAKAKEKKIAVITFSGFQPDNPLRSRGEINFYVPTCHYGHVECIHHFLCHSFIDTIIANKSKLLIERAMTHE